MTSWLNKVPYFVKKMIAKGTSLDWIAIVISLGSVLGTVYWSNQQYELAREHNKKSVQPIINFYIFSEDKNSGYKIQNVGLGPAIMYGLKATNIETGYVQTNWSELVGENIGFQGDFECADVISGTAQAPNVERKPIIIPAGRLINKDTPIKFEACYCSIYDECWIMDSKNGTQAINSCTNFDENIITC